MAAILHTADDAVISIDASHRVVLFNRRAEDAFGYRATQALGQSIDVLLPTVTAALQRHDIDTFSRSGAARRRTGERPEVRGRRRDGSEFDARASIFRTLVEGESVYIVILREDPEPNSFEPLLGETEARHRGEAAQAHLASIVESTDDAIISTALDGTITSWNRGASVIYGYEADDVMGRHISLLASSEEEGQDEVARLLARVGGGDSVIHHETTWLRQGGSVVEVSLTISPLRDPAGAVAGASAIARDITDRRRAESELVHQALHDALTGLPNRALLSDRLDQALARCRRDPGRQVLVAFLDLDRFKVLNDSMGHLAGDSALLAVAERLRGAVRPADTVARFGGDEFVIVCEDAGFSHGAALGKRIAQALEEAVDGGARPVVLSASVGLAVGGAGDCAETLLANADAAMYEAKAKGRARTEEYDTSLRAGLDRRMSIEAALRRAVDREEFRVLYQPIMSLQHGTTVGAEALLRWDSPDPAWSQPDTFIPVAEDTGLIVPIGAWVLSEVARQLEEWTSLLRVDDGFSVSVNLSALELGPALADATFDLTRRGIDPKRITFELTESVLMGDAESSIEALLGLRLVGARLAIDDFGTGYSSLGYLQRLPVNVVKIDRSFVKGLSVNSQDTPIVAAILTMAQALGLSVVAEGVETSEQLGVLTELGCPYAQGFYWSPAVPAADLVSLFSHPMGRSKNLS